MILISLTPGADAAQSIVVLGDSISAGYGIEIQQGWVSLLAKKLQAEWPAYQIHNESISGDTSAGGLARLDQTLKRHKPKLLLLELGANDGLRGLSAQGMQDNLREIIVRSRKAGADVILLGMKIPPNYGKRYIDLFYNIYPALAEQLKVPLVPFILENVALNPELMQADGLHPNAQGQPLIAETVWQTLQPLLIKGK